MWLTYRSFCQLKYDSFDRRRLMQNFTNPASTLSAVSMLYIYWHWVVCFCFQSITFFMKFEETYKFVGKNKTQDFFWFYCWCSRTQLKSTTNSTNAMCNISNNYVACVEICKGIKYFLILISINFFNLCAQVIQMFKSHLKIMCTKMATWSK